MGLISNFSEIEILAFALVLLRIGSFVVSWPVFGVGSVPAPLKILFALVLTIIVFPVVGWNKVSGDISGYNLFWMSTREVLIGLSFGFLAKFFFFAISIMGQIVSTSLGLSSSQLFNPEMGEQTSSIEQFELALATLFFLFLNGHLIFISGLVDSFQFLPLSASSLNLSELKTMGAVVSEVMTIGFKLCAPILVAIFFMNMSMAIIGRTVPQINVLITSLPVNILIGFLMMIISLPIVVSQFQEVLGFTVDNVFRVMRTF